MRAKCLGKDTPKSMATRAAERSFSLLLLWLMPLSCSSPRPPTARDVADANDTGRTLAAKSENERAVLGEAGRLRTGIEERVGKINVLADAPYPAASGHTCRALSITVEGASPATHRVVCTDGQAWFFVPDVFSAMVGTGPRE